MSPAGIGYPGNTGMGARPKDATISKNAGQGARPGEFPSPAARKKVVPGVRRGTSPMGIDKRTHTSSGRG